MAKFVFNLSGLLNIKEKLEEQKKLEFGKAISDLERKKQRKLELLHEKEQCIVSFRTRINEGISPHEVALHNDYIELLKKQIKEQQHLIDKAKHFAEEKRLELVEAVKEHKMFETLRENKYTVYLKEEQLAEQKFVDEITSYKYTTLDR